MLSLRSTSVAIFRSSALNLASTSRQSFTTCPSSLNGYHVRHTSVSNTMQFKLLLVGTYAALASATPALMPRTNNGFSCNIDQHARCCDFVNAPTATGCKAAFGGVGYATCIGSESPACCNTVRLTPSFGKAPYVLLLYFTLPRSTLATCNQSLAVHPVRLFPVAASLHLARHTGLRRWHPALRGPQQQAAAAAPRRLRHCQAAQGQFHLLHGHFCRLLQRCGCGRQRHGRSVAPAGRQRLRQRRRHHPAGQLQEHAVRALQHDRGDRRSGGDRAVPGHASPRQVGCGVVSYVGPT